MLNAISISNFQSHKNTILEFSPGVNVVIGSSDSGKTAIIRALRWLAWNRPSGDSIRSWWGGDTEVKLSLPDFTISRSKGKENLYKLGDLEFRAMGTDVPEEIQKEINFNIINMQQQLDQPFLLNDSPGAVAQHFNKVAQLNVIDRSMSNVKKWIRQITQDDKARRAQLKEAMQELKTYDYLEEMEKEVEVVEYLEKEKISVFQQMGKLKKIVGDLQVVDMELSSHLPLLELEKPVDVILTLFKERKLLDIKQSALEKLIDEIIEVDQGYINASQFLKIEKPVDMILSYMHKRKLLKAQMSTLKAVVEDIEMCIEDIQNAQEKIKKLENQMPEICPFCRQKMPRGKK